jgi:hypothetical protein
MMFLLSRFLDTLVWQPPRCRRGAADLFAGLVLSADASIVTRMDVRVDVVSNNTCRLAVSR